MEISRQEYWSGVPRPSPGDPPNPEMEPRSPALAGRFFTIWATREAPRAGMVLGQKRAKPNNGPWEMCHQQMGEKTKWGFQHLRNQSSFTHLLIFYSTMTYEHLFMVLSIIGTKMALKFWTHMGSKSFKIIFSQPFPLILQNNFCQLFPSSIQLLSHVLLFATPWTAVHQASLSITSSISKVENNRENLYTSCPHSLHGSPPWPASVTFIIVLCFCTPEHRIGGGFWALSGWQSFHQDLSTSIYFKALLWSP